MATLPQFPTSFLPALGYTRAVSGLNLSLPSLAVFTCQIPGVYVVSGLCHLLSTNGVGTLTMSIAFPHLNTVASTVVLTAGGQDGTFGTRMVWMNAGDAVSFFTTATGLTGTSYQCFVNVFQVL
jgi:hypothetical protein